MAHIDSTHQKQRLLPIPGKAINAATGGGVYRLAPLPLLAWLALCGLSACSAIPNADYVNTFHASDSASDQRPAVATDKAGNWVVAWGSRHPLGSLGTDWDLFQSYSRSEGRQWTNVTPLNTGAPNDGKSGDLEPAIAFAAKTGVAVWSSGNDLNGTLGEDLDLWFARTAGLPLGGWQAEQPLHKAAAAADGQFDDDSQVDIATDGKTNWVAVWVRGGLGDSDIMVSRSGNDGISWSAPQALNSDAATDSDDDLFPAIASNGAGRWIVVWYKTSGGAFYSPILYATSTNNGTTWSAPKQLHSKAYGDSPRIDAAGNTWLVSWKSNLALNDSGLIEPNVHYSRSDNNGATWSAPTFLNSDWNDTSGMGIWGHYDFNPDIATDGNGIWVAVWELWLATTLTASDVRYAYSEDDGLNWTVPQYLNPKWDSNAVSETVPRIAADGKGNWVIVSQFAAHVAGNTSADSDIAVHRLKLSKP